MKRHRHGRWQSPGRGGPDDRGNFLPGKRRIDLRGIVEQTVLHPNGGAGVVLVLDFRFGQGGLVVHAPVNGAQAFVDESVFVEREES